MKSICMAVLMAMAFCAAVGCWPFPAFGADRLAVVTTTTDLKFIAESVGGEHAKVVEAGGPGQLAEPGVGRLERQRDEGVETAGVVLELAEADHVVRELRRLFDVAVQHRRVRDHPDAVRGPMHVEPRLAADLALADDAAHSVAEHLGAAAGQRTQAGVFEFGQNRFDRLAG